MQSEFGKINPCEAVKCPDKVCAAHINPTCIVVMAVLLRSTASDFLPLSGGQNRDGGKFRG